MQDVRDYEDKGLSRRNFDQLARYIYDYSGIKMPPGKRTMLEGRLRRRLRATGIGDLDGYCDYLFKRGGIDREAIHLIDAVTTNKTDFFREPKHFEHLENAAIPELLAAGHLRGVLSGHCVLSVRACKSDQEAGVRASMA